VNGRWLTRPAVHASYRPGVRTSHLTLRPFTPEEFEAAYRLLMRVFGQKVEDADIEAERAVFEYDRSLAVFDGDEMVACMGGYGFDMSVPGGSLPIAGTTWVGVSPTHRRQGILRMMMDRHLADVIVRGESVAALWASETAIYGRFGYGTAVERLRCRVDLRGGLHWEATAPGPPTAVHLIGLDEAYETLAPIYEAARRRRAGMHARSEAWWGMQALSTRPGVMDGINTKLVAVAEVDGRDAAYAIHGIGQSTERGRSESVLQVVEMAGVDTHAEAAMWRYLLSHDLVDRVSAQMRPVDEPLPLLLTDQRRVTREPTDALFVRILDIDRALRGRGYRESAGVTIEVTDRSVEANDGTWRVEVAPEGASVESADGTSPDLRMDIRSLGSLYMGDIGLRRLASAGLVEVRNRDVVPSVEAALASDEAGWIPEVW
jgi:predicted acetyltransferase